MKKKSLDSQSSASPLSRINTFLTILILTLNFYTISLPLIPYFQQLLKPKINTKIYEKGSVSAQIKKTNTLVIPSIKLNKQIYEGETFATANKGVWRLPYTSTPDKQSNTVLVGHRFSYVHPEAGVFYSLDKVSLGDDIYLTYQKKIYQYTVKNILEVEPTKVSIENPTKTPVLTLYTCTPLWTSTHRLVIQAHLKEVYSA
jgi:sortase A